jgi:uncharacterized phage-like protein YoqJ
MTTVAITGHRPERIKDMSLVEKALEDAYNELEVSKVIQGMAAGVDLLAAKVAYRMEIPFVSARPWAGHKPRIADDYNYMMAMNYAVEVVNVDPSVKYRGPWVYHNRNEWMVDRAELLIAVWDGTKKGGTFNCIKYAQSKDLCVWWIDPDAGYGELIEPDERIA